jgi:hypothetical protein
VFSVLSVPWLYNTSPHAVQESFSEFQGSRVIEQDMSRRLHVEVLVSVLRSVARRQLLETENPSACAAVDWKVYRIVITLC